MNGSSEIVSTTSVGISGRNCFPLLVVIEELEEVTSLALVDSPSFNRGWVYRFRSLDLQYFALSPSSRCLLKTGVSHGELLEGYMEVFRKWNGKKAGKLLQLLESIGVLALNWTRLASGYSLLTPLPLSSDSLCFRYSTPHSLEVQEFQMCSRSGKFRNWMEKLLQQLSTLSGHVLTPQERRQLQAAQMNLKEAESKVVSLLLV